MKKTYYFEHTSPCQLIQITRKQWRARQDHVVFSYTLDYSTEPPAVLDRVLWHPALHLLGIPTVIYRGDIYRHDPDTHGYRPLEL